MADSIARNQGINDFVAMNAPTELIPRWPICDAELDAHGNGSLTIEDEEIEIAQDSVEKARDEVLDVVAAFAADQLGRPVRLNTSDPSGHWQLAVHPDRSVQELEGSGTHIRATPTATARRPAAVALATASGLAVLIAAVVLVVTSGGNQNRRQTAQPQTRPVPSRAEIVHRSAPKPSASKNPDAESTSRGGDHRRTQASPRHRRTRAPSSATHRHSLKAHVASSPRVAVAARVSRPAAATTVAHVAAARPAVRSSPSSGVSSTAACGDFLC